MCMQLQVIVIARMLWSLFHLVDGCRNRHHLLTHMLQMPVAAASLGVLETQDDARMLPHAAPAAAAVADVAAAFAAAV